MSSSVLATQTVHHELNLELNPATGILMAEDKITLPEKVSFLEFDLHSGLVLSPDDDVSLKTIERSNYAVPTTSYRVTFGSPQQSVTVRYQGRIAHGPDRSSPDYADTGQWTPGIISSDGIFLGGSSIWYPQIASYPLSFSMRVRLPEGWTAISQGQPVSGTINSWQERSPQEEIYLIAGRYHVYEQSAGKVKALVYLINPDPALAERYMEVTEQYIDLYSRMIGVYPYKKFALVENFLQTGYGMPSFTLLGSRVIRLPFIPYTSYPHEILHNWWGNSVYIDYSSGNWSEGLTAYLADHLLKEQRGKGADYRRDALQRYTDYVSEEKDFPLALFRGRHSRASQAIGYGKTLMFFHMIRQYIGDRDFIDALRILYQRNRFRVAGYQQLQNAFEEASGRQLSWMFKQWLLRTGLPELEISSVSVKPANGQYKLILELAQTQNEDAFELQIPLWIQTAGNTNPLHKSVRMTRKQQIFSFSLDATPLRIAVDPRFDVLRRLHSSETPSSLGQLFGADQGMIILPGKEQPEIARAYQKLAEQWAENSQGFRVIQDHEINKLPDDRAVWLFGQHNRFIKQLSSHLADHQFSMKKNTLTLNGSEYLTNQYSFAITGHNRSLSDQSKPATFGWLVSQNLKSLPGLARKIPHYSKYSYVVFEGDTPTNVLKGQWQLNDSSMWLALPGAEAVTPMKIPHVSALSETANN